MGILDLVLLLMGLTCYLQTGKQSSLSEFFLSYLQKQYGDATAMEWSYTLFDNMRLC